MEILNMIGSIKMRVSIMVRIAEVSPGLMLAGDAVAFTASDDELKGRNR